MNLIEGHNLVKHFPTPNGPVRAVDGVSFAVEKGQTVGLVGESGCGKSTIGRVILNLIQPTSGRLLYQGRDIFKLPRNERRGLRREMGIVFQNPYSSLNPRMNILNLVGEPLLVHDKLKGDKLLDRVIGLLEAVGLKSEHVNRYPHQFSGGQRQRISIARSLALKPGFLVLDEPTSALDVSVQAQVLNLLGRLQKERGLTYLFITHDLHVVRHVADRVMVMYLGRLVEEGAVSQVLESPAHPYTQALLAAVPEPDPDLRRARKLLKGEVPSPLNPPPGCRFHDRCPMAAAVCAEREPEFRFYGEDNDRHGVACHLVEGELL